MTYLEWSQRVRPAGEVVDIYICRCKNWMVVTYAQWSAGAVTCDACGWTRRYAVRAVAV